MKMQIDEADLKKLLLMALCSKPFVQLDPLDNFLGNLWRVAPKTAEKIINQNGYVVVESNGRKVIKRKDEIEESSENSPEPVKRKRRVRKESAK